MLVWSLAIYKDQKKKKKKKKNKKEEEKEREREREKVGEAREIHMKCCLETCK